MNSTPEHVADRIPQQWPPSDRQFVAGGVLLAMVVWLTSASPVAVSPDSIPEPVAMSVPAPVDELPSAGPELLDAALRRDAELEARMAVHMLKAEVAAMTDVEIWARTRLDLLKSE